jgi:hypothetical protein
LAVGIFITDWVSAVADNIAAHAHVHARLNALRQQAMTCPGDLPRFPPTLPPSALPATPLSSATINVPLGSRSSL